MHALEQRDRHLQARSTNNMQLLPDAQCPSLYPLPLAARACLGHLLLRADSAAVELILSAVLGACIILLLQ